MKNDTSADGNYEDAGSFEQRLHDALCEKLIELGEIKTPGEFLASYPKDRLAEVHDNQTGAYFLMKGEKPLKLVEYNLLTYSVKLIN
ncbi:hypothetical protein [Pedobacter sp. SYSU D00535]|uniref:hypothetical protein n=1 Tax=Pedobacter sp. SYSU D00535 TaxID=2810308 RepID=UPI001A9617D2|nr:hypothetical protein [Pedobacter sp. SYSU D00535]